MKPHKEVPKPLGHPALAGVFLLFTVVFTTGFIPTRSSGGAVVTWGHGARLVFRSNEVNSSGLNAGAIFDIFSRSLNRWKQAAFGGFDFVYYQGTDTAAYPNYTGSSTDNSIFFTSNARSASDQLACGTVAVTQVWYNTGNGQAIKADLKFNDKCFRFTNNPTDTVSQRSIYLADVATHELGHALGLDHSQSIQSSMVYTAAIQQALPSCDDQAAMLSLYAPGGVQNQTGTIRGAVVSPAGNAIFGAFVEAVSLERGVTLASALSDRDGSYVLRGLEPGTYTVVVSPFAPGPNSLSSYYGTISSNVCGGSTFQRSFVLEGNTLKTVAVAAGADANMGTNSVSCSPIASRFGGAERSFTTAPTVSAAGLSSPIAVVGSFSSGFDHFYRVANVSGAISISALSYSLYARNDVVVELYDGSGRRLANQRTMGDVFAAPSGYVNYDAKATVDLGSSPSEILVRVTSRGPIPTGAYPSGNVGLDANPFYVVTMSHSATPDTSLYAGNARCERSDAFESYARQGDPGPVGSGGDSGANTGGSGGCGMIMDSSPDDHDPFNNTGAQIRLINFALLLACLALARAKLARQASN